MNKGNTNLCKETAPDAVSIYNNSYKDERDLREVVKVLEAVNTVLTVKPKLLRKEEV